MFEGLQHYYRSERIDEIYLHAQLSAEERKRREQERCRKQELKRNKSYAPSVPGNCLCCDRA